MCAWSPVVMKKWPGSRSRRVSSRPGTRGERRWGPSSTARRASCSLAGVRSSPRTRSSTSTGPRWENRKTRPKRGRCSGRSRGGNTKSTRRSSYARPTGGPPSIPRRRPCDFTSSTTTRSRRTSLPATARIKPAGMGSKASAPRWSSVSTATFIRSWASRLEPSCAAFGDSVGPCASTMPQRLHSHESVQHASLDVESRYRDRSGDGEYGRLRARAWDDRLGAVGRRLRRGGADRRARACGEGPRRARPGRDPGRPSLARRDDIGLQGGASSHQSDRRACARWSVLGRAAGRRFGPRVRNRHRVQGGRGGGPCRGAQEHRLRPARSRCGDRRGTRYHRAAGPDGRRYRRRDDGDRGLGADRCRRARIDQGRGRHVRCRDHEPPAAQRFLIGPLTAERLKIERSYAGRPLGRGPLRVSGTDVAAAAPRSRDVPEELVGEAMVEGIRHIAQAIVSVLEELPPDLSADLLDSGISLTGGGALIPGLASELGQLTNVPTMVAPEPMLCVAKGAGEILATPSLLERLRPTTDRVTRWYQSLRIGMRESYSR